MSAEPTCSFANAVAARFPDVIFPKREFPEFDSMIVNLSNSVPGKFVFPAAAVPDPGVIQLNLGGNSAPVKRLLTKRGVVLDGFDFEHVSALFRIVWFGFHALRATTKSDGSLICTPHAELFDTSAAEDRQEAAAKLGIDAASLPPALTFGAIYDRRASLRRLAQPNDIPAISKLLTLIACIVPEFDARALQVVELIAAHHGD